MKKATLKLTVILLTIFFSGTTLLAEEESPKLLIDFDTTFTSEYIWRGYDVHDDHGATQPSINLDFFGTGLSANVWSSFPIGSGNEEVTELDYAFTYAKSIAPDEKYAIDFSTSFIYFDYPKANKYADAQELNAIVALPSLLSLGEIAVVPSYCASFLWPSSSGVDNVAGSFHILGLILDLPIKYPLKSGIEQTISFGSEIVYNDGAYDADHDWSNATFNISTGFAIGKFTITPAIFYQISMDDSVNDENELWTSLSVTLSF